MKIKKKILYTLIIISEKLKKLTFFIKMKFFLKEKTPRIYYLCFIFYRKMLYKNAKNNISILNTKTKCAEFFYKELLNEINSNK